MDMTTLYWVLVLGVFALFTYIMGRMQRGGSPFLEAFERVVDTIFKYNREMDSTLYMLVLAILIWKFSSDNDTEGAEGNEQLMLIGGLLSIGSFLFGKKVGEKDNGGVK